MAKGQPARAGPLARRDVARVGQRAALQRPAAAAAAAARSQPVTQFGERGDLSGVDVDSVPLPHDLEPYPSTGP